MATSESLRRIDHDRRLGSTVSTELTDCESRLHATNSAPSRRQWSFFLFIIQKVYLYGGARPAAGGGHIEVFVPFACATLYLHSDRTNPTPVDDDDE